jgi:hypothetical protein
MLRLFGNFVPHTEPLPQQRVVIVRLSDHLVSFASFSVSFCAMRALTLWFVPNMFFTSTTK